MSVPTLTTDRLVLEPLDPERHAADLYGFWSDPRYGTHQMQVPPASPAEAAAKVAWVHGTPPGLGGWLTRRRDTGEPAGRVSLRPWVHDPAGPPEMGWHLAPRYWGQGLATEAARAVLGHAWGAVGLAQVIALVLLDNTPSRAVALRLGFTEDGEGDWYGADARCVRYRLAAPDRPGGPVPAGSMVADPPA